MWQMYQFQDLIKAMNAILLKQYPTQDKY